MTIQSLLLLFRIKKINIEFSTSFSSSLNSLVIKFYDTSRYFSNKCASNEGSNISDRCVTIETTLREWKIQFLVFFYKCMLNVLGRLNWWFRLLANVSFIYHTHSIYIILIYTLLCRREKKNCIYFSLPLSLVHGDADDFVSL